MDNGRVYFENRPDVDGRAGCVFLRDVAECTYSEALGMADEYVAASRHPAFQGRWNAVSPHAIAMTAYWHAVADAILIRSFTTALGTRE